MSVGMIRKAMHYPFQGVMRLIEFIFANTIGRLFFPSKYLRGRWFAKIESPGWQWVARGVFFQKICGYNRQIPWPVSHRIVINSPENIIFDIDDLNNFQGIGNYFQNLYGKIIIGKGCYIAPNVGMITANHDKRDLDKHCQGENIVLGEGCWIGMNAVLLPGVILGPNTIVGAGAVVTKSYIEGNCVIVGNPAKIREVL